MQGSLFNCNLVITCQLSNCLLLGYSNDILQYNLLLLFSTYALQPSRLTVRSGLDVPTFPTRRLHASPRESTQRRKAELWARNVREFCLNADSRVIFRDLLHAIKLRQGTDGFTSPPKEGVMIFSL